MLLQGNALQIPLADESVHCVITSPPYWGLRDYGIGGQLGLESTPEQYIENMVAVFREVKRVMRHDGTCWLNLGDSYATGHKTGTTDDEKGWSHGNISKGHQGRAGMPEGLKPKDLCGIPWRVALALQADGWWLRSDIIWSKPNPMPESVTDRPTKAHEYLFLLTKSARYYYDADAVREDADTPLNSKSHHRFGLAGGKVDTTPGKNKKESGEMWTPTSGRNRRTVWHIATAPYSGAHFATYPPALVEPCIKAGTSEHGVCPECGSPWERVKKASPEYQNILDMNKGNYHPARDKEAEVGAAQGWGDARNNLVGSPSYTTLGWQPTCDPNNTEGWACDEGKTSDPIPATVFDPFAGSGTTLQVARALGRHGVGLDLSAEYLQLARKRLSLDALDAWENGSKNDGKEVTDLPMFEELQ